jgi:hypothetical protein
MGIRVTIVVGVIGLGVGGMAGLWMAAWKMDALMDKTVTGALWWGMKSVTGVLVAWGLWMWLWGVTQRIRLRNVLQMVVGGQKEKDDD